MIENLGRVIAWKYRMPFTRRGDLVEIEGIGPVDLITLESSRAEWLATTAEKFEPTTTEIMAAIRRRDPLLAAEIDAETSKRGSGI